MSAASDQPLPRLGKPPFANLYWFPLAALYAALALPLSVGGQLGWFWVPEGLSTPWGHGHEMIFGFALAVIAGYIAGPMAKRDTVTWLALWLAARLSFWFFPATALTIALNVAFVAMLVHKLAPLFLRTAKKWRNKSVGVILLGLLSAAMGFHLLPTFSSFDPSFALTGRVMLLEAVLLLSALMFYMGGRIIAPALAGHFQRHGVQMKDRVQPALEGSMLLLLLTVLLLNLLPYQWIAQLNAILLLLCAFLGLVRIARWRPWWCRDRADLLLMLVGYLWIKVGWVWIALSFWFAQIPITQALHAITIGALGTLTFTVMARSRAHRVLRDPNAKPWLFVLALSFSLAALLRLTAAYWNYPLAMLLAVVLWSSCFIALLGWLYWLRRQEIAQQTAA